MPTIKIVPFPGKEGPAGPAGATGPAGADASFPDPVSWTPLVYNSGFIQSSNQSTGTYFKLGKIVFVNLLVPFSSVTNFGTGQFAIDLPFPSARHTDVFGGSLHNVSASDHYSIKGHLSENSSAMTIWAISTATKDEHFTPVYPISLATEDLFHMSFTYEIQEA